MSNFKPVVVNKVLNIDTLYTVHYMEFSRSFVFIGETHDFWEFQYCDKGEIEVMADRTGLVLHQGEIIFHKPNEFHNIWANGRIAPNLMVITFKCNDEIMYFFERKILKPNKECTNLLSSIFIEAKKVFSPPFGDPYTTKIDFLPNHNKISEQLFKNLLETFLLKLIEDTKVKDKPLTSSSYIIKSAPKNLIDDIKDFLLFNIYNNIVLDDISKRFSISKEWLCHVFKVSTGSSIIDYFIHMKIAEAKRMLREDKLNITQIAERLGYTSMHYFSRQFKKVAGMTPSEYTESIIT